MEFSPGDALTLLYTPRKDSWRNHFQFRPSGLIVPRTEIGQGTIRVLNLNDVNRVQAHGVFIQTRIHGKPQPYVVL